MKKILAFFLTIITFLTVTGCQPVHTPDESTAASETAPTGTTALTQPSSDPTPPVTYSTDPPEGLPAGHPYDTSYTIAPEEFFPFLYNGTCPYAWEKLDTSDCVVGRLYVHHRNEDVIIEICESQVTSFTETQVGLYYVTEAEPDTIYRSDYAGANREPVFQADGACLRLVNFKLLDGKGILEIIIDDKQAALYYLEDQKLDILMEQVYITRFGFEYDLDACRLMLGWYGRVSEDEEAIHCYLTYLDTGETVDWNHL